MRPDAVCRHNADKKINLMIKILDEDSEFPESILLEGNEETFLFLSELMKVFANDQMDDGFGICPTATGSLLFSTDAACGLYLHRVKPV